MLKAGHFNNQNVKNLQMEGDAKLCNIPNRLRQGKLRTNSFHIHCMFKFIIIISKQIKQMNEIKQIPSH